MTRGNDFWLVNICCMFPFVANLILICIRGISYWMRILYVLSSQSPFLIVQVNLPSSVAYVTRHFFHITFSFAMRGRKSVSQRQNVSMSIVFGLPSLVPKQIKSTWFKVFGIIIALELLIDSAIIAGDVDVSCAVSADMQVLLSLCLLCERDVFNLRHNTSHRCWRYVNEFYALGSSGESENCVNFNEVTSGIEKFSG